MTKKPGYGKPRDWFRPLRAEITYKGTDTHI